MARRSKRKVNYRELAGDSGDSEDDFVCGPPLKKSREKDKGKMKDKQSNSNVSKPVDPPPVRLSRDEKMFNKQLEQAISVSKSNVAQEDPSSSVASDGVNIQPNLETTEKSAGDSDFIPPVTEDQVSSDESYSGDEESDPDFESSPPPPSKKVTKSNKQSSSKVAKTKPATKKRAPKEANSPNSHTPHIPQSAKTKRTLKDNDVPPSKLTTSSSVESTVAVKPSTSAARGSPAAMGTPRGMAKWTPPSRVGSNNSGAGTMRASPKPFVSGGGTPVIRVGLSRNARVKPLHTPTANT